MASRKPLSKQLHEKILEVFRKRQEAEDEKSRAMYSIYIDTLQSAHTILRLMEDGKI